VNGGQENGGVCQCVGKMGVQAIVIYPQVLGGKKVNVQHTSVIFTLSLENAGISRE